MTLPMSICILQPQPGLIMRRNACIIALDGDDSLLDDIYGSYYRGDLKAKELNAALKAHRAGDRRGAEALRNEAKVRANR